MRRLPRKLAGRLNFAGRSAALAAGLNLIALTAPAIARADGAQAPSDDVAARDAIYLKNGGILRGTLVDAIPNDHARIELATHEIATIAWADILRIEHGQAPAPVTGADGSATAAPDKSLVWVHIEGSDDAVLEYDPTNNDNWAPVCTAPCDRQVSTAYWYRIAGNGVRASSHFMLQGPIGAHETLTVAQASNGKFIAGVVLAPVGGIVAYVGLVLGVFGTIAANSHTTTPNADGTTTTNTVIPPGVAAAGWTMFGVGAAAGIAGLVIAIFNWKTSVTQNTGVQTAALNEVWKMPAPTWREPSPEQRAAPPPLAAPIFTGQF